MRNLFARLVSKFRKHTTVHSWKQIDEGAARTCTVCGYSEEYDPCAGLGGAYVAVTQGDIDAHRSNP